MDEDAWIECHCADTSSLLDLIQAVREEGGGTALIRERIDNHPSLIALWLNDNGLTPADLAALEIERRTTLRSLLLSQNPLGDEGARLVTSLLQRLRLFVVNLDFCRIGDEGAHSLSAALAQHGCLRKLSLNYNQIGSAGGVALGRALAGSPALIELSIEHNELDDLAMQAIFAGLRANDTLTSLDLGGNAGLGAEGARLLGEYVRASRSLSTLRLNRIRGIEQDIVARQLAHSLAFHPSLRKLHLCGVGLTDAGGVPLAEALRTNESLVSLELFDNRLGDRTATALAASLRLNCTLRRLALSNNKIDQQGAAALLSAFGDNSSIEAVSMSGNVDITPAFCAHLLQHCSRNEARRSTLSPSLLTRLLSALAEVVD